MAFLNVLHGLSHFILAIPVFNFPKTRLGFRSLRPCWKGFSPFSSGLVRPMIRGAKPSNDPIGLRWRVGFAKPSKAYRDDPELRGKRVLLRRPHGPVQGKGMENDDGETGSLIVVGNGDAVDVGVPSVPSRRRL